MKETEGPLIWALQFRGYTKNGILKVMRPLNNFYWKLAVVWNHRATLIFPFLEVTCRMKHKISVSLPLITTFTCYTTLFHDFDANRRPMNCSCDDSIFFFAKNTSYEAIFHLLIAWFFPFLLSATYLPSLCEIRCSMKRSCDVYFFFPSKNWSYDPRP